MVIIKRKRQANGTANPGLGIRQPNRFTRNRRRICSRYQTGISLLLCALAGISVLGGISDHVFVFVFTRFIVVAPLALVIGANFIADVFRLPTSVRQHLALLRWKTCGIAALGFVVAVLQVFFSSTKFASSGTIDLVIVTLAGVGTWPHAIEAHFIVKQRLPARKTPYRSRVSSVGVFDAASSSAGITSLA
jgi:hypothetical protein